MSLSTMLYDLFNVFAAALILGAGLPALFALGTRLISGTGVVNPDGSVTHTKDATPLQKALAGICFLIIMAMIVVGILWITKAVIYHSFNIDIFGTEAVAAAGH